jgi:hypothetical protein
MRTASLVLSLVAVAALGSGATAGEPKPKESVVLAKSWEAAVEEAKLVGVPLVVHSHGFYCGPCWGMHSALMLNDDYIKFAADNTVEVIALERLDEGVEKKDARAETYKAKVNGEEVHYLVEFPGLTVEEMNALARSKASSYNKTGKIPYTCLVDPWTEEEIASFPGSTPKGDIEEAVLKAREAFQKEHGKGVARKDLRTVAETEGDAQEKVAKSDYAGALALLAKTSAKAKAWPQPLQDRLASAKEKIVASATEALAKIEAEAAEDKPKAKGDLARLMGKLKGTGLEEKAKSLLATLSS